MQKIIIKRIYLIFGILFNFVAFNLWIKATNKKRDEDMLINIIVNSKKVNSNIYIDTILYVFL